jgi:hypothetical protein
VFCNPKHIIGSTFQPSIRTYSGLTYFCRCKPLYKSGAKLSKDLYLVHSLSTWIPTVYHPIFSCYTCSSRRYQNNNDWTRCRVSCIIIKPHLSSSTQGS